MFYYILFYKMNPYSNKYSYFPHVNQSNTISQSVSQNWGLNSNNNYSNQNQKNAIWNNTYSPYNNLYSLNKNQIEKKKQFLNPYNFSSNNHDYSNEKTNQINYNNYNLSSHSSQNSFENKNIWNSSLPNNPISMYTNNYNKADTIIEPSNNNSYLSSTNYNLNYNSNYNQNNNYSKNNNSSSSNKNNNNYYYNNYNKNNYNVYNENKNNKPEEKKEENIIENKEEITFDSNRVETWGDFTQYWIFLHHHNVIQGLQNLIYSKKNFFVFMYGTHDTRGVSWCSDCYYAEPNVNLIKGIIASKEKEKEIYFVNIPIDKEKKSFYKQNQILKMSHVPTLIYFENGKEIRRIIQNDLFNKDRVVDFVMKSYKRFY